MDFFGAMRGARGRRAPAQIDLARHAGPEREQYSMPERSPRVTDDDDDGLAGAMVPRKPSPQNRSGGAALTIPKDDSLPS